MKSKYKKCDNKRIEWLENNMNKFNYFYFKENKEDKNIIDCYWKGNDKSFCVFYGGIIDKLIEDENIPTKKE
ncbi:MAG: hypothetical protein J6T15_04850 [Bacilli bacterium]|nr:hypothetical protein [Bacilli bacterium]